MTQLPLTTELPWPRWFRVVVIALATCILCSCRSLAPPADRVAHVAAARGTTPSRSNEAAFAHRSTRSRQSTIRAQVAPSCTVSDRSAPAGSGRNLDGALATGTCARASAPQPWRPAGIAPPWPRNEYLCDGGDCGLPSRARADGRVGAPGIEDTLARFDTDDGRVGVVPSNRVCIYAPRFGAVRRVTGPSIYEARNRLDAVELPEQLRTGNRRLPASTTLQRLQPRGALGRRAGSVYRGRQQGGGLEGRVRLATVDRPLMPYEDLAIIRVGQFDQRDTARLVQAVDAAIVWTRNQAVQVILDGRSAAAATSDTPVQVVYHVNSPHNPRLRLVKIASKTSARPGETVDFTIRYDNVGDQTIRTVTLVDNLTSRLEFVPGSAHSTIPGDFSTSPNQVGSKQLRWELTTPLKPGAGGTVHFRCKVR